MNVLLLFGGRSEEHEVSLRSAASLLSHIDRTKYSVLPVGIDKKNRWIHLNEDQEKQLMADSGSVSLIELPDTQKALWDSSQQSIVGAQGVFKCDVVFSIIHGTTGEDGCLQGLFELSQTPYVGAGVASSAICMDKDYCKMILQQSGFAVVPSVTVRSLSSGEADVVQAKLGWPLFVKPCNAGSSVGVSKVEKIEDLQPALEKAFKIDSKVLVETAIQGRELECAVLGNQQPKASEIAEICPQGDFYDYESKYMNDQGAKLVAPAPMDDSLKKELQDQSVRAFQALDVRGLARVDFFVDEKNKRTYINEVNTLPGFTSISQYPILWELSGVPYPKLIDELIQLALED